VREEPEEEREGGAKKEAGDDREVEGGVFATVDDVAGKTAESERKPPAKIKKSAQNDDESTENEERAAKFAKGVHGGILPPSARKSSCGASII
jgi:hypothetical protein